MLGHLTSHVELLLDHVTLNTFTQRWGWQAHAISRMMRFCLAFLSLYASSVLAAGLNTTYRSLNISSTPQKSTSKTKLGFGDYVAAGIGLESTSAGSLHSTTTRALLVDATSSIKPSGVGSESSVLFNSNGTFEFHLGTAGITTSANASVGLRQCWDRWSTYWDGLPTYSISPQLVCVPTSDVITGKGTTTVTVERSDLTPYTTTLLNTYTETIDNNGFATSTYYRTDTNVWTNTRYSEGTTYTYTSSWANTYTDTCDFSYSTSALAPTPNCTLPSTVIPECEDAWNSWVSVQLTRSSIDGTETSYKSAGAAPSCTQASIAESYCTSLKDAFVSSSLALNYFSKILPSNITTGYDGGAIVHWSGGYYSYGTQDWKWPPSTAFFAPSCTL